MRKYYPGLTLFKFTGAVMVVLTHIKAFPLNDVLNTYMPGFTTLCSVVVPAFYVMAGFLACKGWMHAAQPGRYIRQYVLWIGRVYALFCLLQFFTDPLSVVRTGSFAYRSLRYYIEPFFISGPYPQLWFIPPMVVAVVLGYWAERSHRLVYLGAFVLLGYLLACSIFGPLQALTNQVLGDFSLSRQRQWGLFRVITINYLSFGFPFVLAGIYIAKWEEWFSQLNKWRLIAPTLFLSITELAILRFLYPQGYPYGMLFAHLPLTLLLFYGLLKAKGNWVKPYHAYLRRLSLFLFFVHWPLIAFNSWFLGSTTERLLPSQLALCIALTFSQILLLERLVTWLQQKYQNKRAIVLSA